MGLKEIEKQVESEITQRRNNALIKAENKLREVFKDNKIKEVYEKYQDLKIEYSKSLYLKDNKNQTSLKNELLSLKNKMKILLKDKNIESKNLKPKFICEICEDTGFINDQKCSCYKKLLSSKLLELSNINKNFLPSFESTSYEIVKNSSQKEILKKVSSLLKQFCEKIDETKINMVLLSGEVGVGKTYQMECAINYLINNGKYVVYFSAFNFNKRLLECHLANLENRNEILKSFIDCDVLCVDDLGTENIIKNVTIEYLFSILNERSINNKKTIITTNLDISQLNERYGERIFSRMVDSNNCLKLGIQGDDLRFNK